MQLLWLGLFPSSREPCISRFHFSILFNIVNYLYIKYAYLQNLSMNRLMVDRESLDSVSITSTTRKTPASDRIETNASQS